jgi:uncharacterized membrane protein (GlpM family)
MARSFHDSIEFNVVDRSPRGHPGLTQRRGDMKHLLIKAAVSVAIILLATGTARRFPSLAGLIGVMPLTGALVLVWIYLENKGDTVVMQNYAVGALFGIVPSILFFLVALVAFRRGLSLHVVLIGGTAAWLMGALVHQFFLR